MKFNIHAGHNPDGKVACGAVGIIKESTEARNVKKYLIKYLKAAGHTVYDTTCNDGKNQSDVLNKIVAKCNEHVVDLDISNHFNSGANDEKGNSKTTGVEVLVYSLKDKDTVAIAKNICKEVAKLGFKNRGVKERPDLYVLNATKSTAILIECCFVDDKDDVKIYSAKKMAKAIAIGILNSIPNKTYIAKKKVALYTSEKKNGKTKPKGTKFEINQYKFINGLFMGHIKSTKSWVRIKKMKLES